jgi:glycosyltransferase involved in cell wall biosynthesis
VYHLFFFDYLYPPLLKIAVNTRFLLPGALEGFGWYTHEIVRRMVLQHPEDSFLFLFDRPYDTRFLYGPNVTPKVLFPPARHPILFYSWFEYSVPRALKQWGADVFFSPDSMCSLTSKVPVAMTVHDIVPLHFPEQIPWVTRMYLTRQLPKMIHRADKILTVSDYVGKDIAIMCQVPASDIQVVYNGSRTSFVPLNETEKMQVRQTFSKGAPYFFYTGAIHPRKNIHRLIRAFSAFKAETGSQVQLLLAGRFAWQTGEVKTAWEQSAYKSDIHFLGYVSEEDLCRLMAAALALCYLSLSEGFGLPMVEAMNTGTPVLAANATCLPEVAGDAALLVDPMSENAIQLGLKQLYEQDALRASLIARGHIRKEAFSWDTAAEQVYEALKSLYQKANK